MAVDPTKITVPEPPSLPFAPLAYDRPHQDQFANVLRLYFNRLTNALSALFGSSGGALLRFPYGAFHQDGVTTLTAAMTNTSTTPIAVVSTADFASTGSLLIGNELISYTGKTPTTFTGITRGAYTSTNVAHSIGDAVSESLGVASAATARSIPFTATDASNQVALNTTNTAHVDFAVSGYYNIQFSAQLYNNTSTEDRVTFWFRKNGVDVPNSAGLITMQKSTGSGTGEMIIGWNLVIDITAGQYIELYFSSDTGNTVVTTYPAGTAPVHPVSPSVILTTTFVSAL